MKSEHKKGRRALTMGIASAIYRARTRAKMSRVEVARAAGVTRQFVKFCEILWLNTVDEADLLAVLRVLEVDESALSLPPEALPPFRRVNVGRRAPHKHRGLLSRLSREDRDILRKLEAGQSEREIAVGLGISPAAVNTRKFTIERTLVFFANLKRVSPKSIRAALHECSPDEVNAIIRLFESIERGRYLKLGPEHRGVLNALYLTECSDATRTPTRTKIFRMLKGHSKYLRMLKALDPHAEPHVGATEST